MAQANGLVKSRLTVPADELSTIEFDTKIQFVSLRLMSDTGKLAYSTKKSSIASVDDDETGLLDGALGMTEVNIYRAPFISKLYVYADSPVLIQWEHEKL